MHPAEIEHALESLTLIVDTREQDTNRARRRIARTELPYIRRALSFGDYSCMITLPDGSVLDFSSSVAIERKMDLDEIAACFTRHRARFEREFQRAKANHAKLYLLIENASWEKVIKGDYRSRMHPKALMASLTAWLARYDCQIIMCDELTSPRLIRELLYREVKEMLGGDDRND